MPSMSPGRPTNRPNSVMLRTFALDLGTGRELVGEALPRVGHALLQAERDAALGHVDVQHHHFDFLRGRHDLAGVHVLLGPAHLGDVDQTLDARLQLDERAVVGDVGDAALELEADRVLGTRAVPRIAHQLLHAERDALRLGVEADDLHLDLLADGEGFRRMVDALPGDVGDVQQAVDAAQIHERAVVGDVLDDAVEHLASDSAPIRRVRSSARVSSMTARRDTTMLPRRRSILRMANCWPGPSAGPTSRTGRTSTWLPGRKATAPDRSTVKPPFTRPKIVPMTRSWSVNAFSRTVQASSRRALSRDRTASPSLFSMRSTKMSTMSPSLTSGGLGATVGELTQRDAALGLEADIHHDEIVGNANDAALDDRAFEARRTAQRFFE